MSLKYEFVQKAVIQDVNIDKNISDSGKFDLLGD